MILFTIILMHKFYTHGGYLISSYALWYLFIWENVLGYISARQQTNVKYWVWAVKYSPKICNHQLADSWLEQSTGCEWLWKQWKACWVTVSFPPSQDVKSRKRDVESCPRLPLVWSASGWLPLWHFRCLIPTQSQFELTCSVSGSSF